MDSAPIHTSTLVFVGGPFPLTMFDERALFSGQLDSDQLKAGPVGRFSYSSGTYGFVVTPERIDLRCRGTEIVPDELVDAGKLIAADIQPARRVVSVSGIGMNCDTVFDHRDIGMTGIKFCNRFVHQPRVSKLIGTSQIATAERIVFNEGMMRYDIRLEPDPNSSGNNLLVAINGHQIVSRDDPMEGKLGEVGAFRTYIESFHQRIIAEVARKG